MALAYERPRSNTAAAWQLVRCRKCQGCLKVRQALWGYRCHIEHMRAERTWWITLTCRKARHLPDYEEVKLTLKKWRKRHSFRYVVSEEFGAENERIHWHVLLHTQRQFTRRQVEAGWKHGFVHARLAKTEGLGKYLAKYAAKNGKIRPSQAYGGELAQLSLLPQCLQDQCEAFERGELGLEQFAGQAGWWRPFGFKIPIAEILELRSRDPSEFSCVSGKREVMECPF